VLQKQTPASHWLHASFSAPCAEAELSCIGFFGAVAHKALLCRPKKVDVFAESSLRVVGVNELLMHHGTKYAWREMKPKSFL
jgi:hypothetical protein